MVKRVNMKKKIAIFLSIFLILTACKDKSQEEKKETSSVVNSTEGIKITENVVKEKKLKEKKAQDKGKFYYSYNEKEENSNNQTQRTYTPVEAYSRIRSPYEKVEIELLAKKLSKNFLVHCSACHDDYANGIIGPSLLDKDEEFIYNRLITYKDKKKANVLMKDLVSKLSKDELRALAKEIATFNKKIRELRAKYNKRM